MNEILLILCWAVYVWSTLSMFRTKRVGIWLGVNIGVTYLSLLPLTAFWLAGTIRAPSRTRIPTVSWSNDAEYVTMILVFVLLLRLCMLFAEHWSHSLLHRRTTGKHGFAQRSTNVEILKILVAGYFVSALVVFIASGLASGQGHWAGNKHDFMVQQGVLGLVLLLVAASFRVGVLIIAGGMLLRKQLAWFHVALLLTFVCAVDLYTTGNRIFTLTSLICCSVVMMLHNQRKLIFAAAAFAIPFGYVMKLYESVRSNLYNWDAFTFSSMWSSAHAAWLKAKSIHGVLSVPDYLIGITEGGSVNVLIGVLRLFPERLEYLYGSTISKPLFILIPRSMWPDKPETFSATIGKIFIPRSQVSLSSLIIGEFYGNFGVFGILVIPLVLVACVVLLRHLVDDHATFTICSLAFGFTVVRLSISDTILIFVSAALIIRYLQRVLGANSARKGNAYLPRVPGFPGRA